MTVLIPLLVLFALMAILAWMRKGNGGRIGRAVRDSDHDAWRMAVADKKEELRMLMAAKPGLANATQQINQPCTECGGTGWRIRKSDDAPVACVFCDGPTVNGTSPHG